MEQWRRPRASCANATAGWVLVDERRLVKIRGDQQHPGSRGIPAKPLRLDHYQSDTIGSIRRCVVAPTAASEDHRLGHRTGRDRRA